MFTAVCQFIEAHQSWLLTLAVQSSCILALGLLVAWVSGRIAASFESFVLRSTIIALFAIPSVTAAMHLGGVESDFFDRDAITTWTNQAVETSDAAEQIAASNEDISALDLRRPFVPENNTVPIPFEPSSERAIPVSVVTHNRTETADSTESDQLGQVSLIPLLVLFWSITCVLQLLLLTHAMWRVRRAVDNSDVAEPKYQRVLDELCGLVSTKSIPVRIHSGISSPCLCGIVRPVILIPSDCNYTDTELRSVLVHELGHVIRHDTHWQLAGFVIRAVYCFNPLAWLLAFRHEVCADEVCDDLVAESGQDVRSYSLLLLSIAEQRQSRRLAVAGMIGMATIKSRLGRRIVRLTKDSRWRRFRPGRCFAATVSLFALVVGGFVSVASIPAADDQNESIVKPQPPKLLKAVVPDANTDKKVKARTADSKESKPIEDGSIRQVTGVPTWINFSGKINDSKGTPVSGARIRIGVKVSSELGQSMGLGSEVETQSDEQGNYKTLAIGEDLAWEGARIEHYLIVEAPGYELKLAKFKFDGTPIVQRNVSLQRSTFQFERKFVDQYGAPWSELSLRLKSVHLDDQHSTVIQGELFDGGIIGGGQFETDEDGVLKIAGLPKFRKLTLEVKDSAVYTLGPIVIAKNKKDLQAPPISLNRSQPLVGFVVNDKSEPIKNALVEYRSCKYLQVGNSSSGGTGASGFAKTDSRGRFEIKGLPPKGQFSCVIGVRPRATKARAMLPKILVVTSESVKQDTPLRIQLEPGISVSGRVVDPHPKPGIRSVVWYLPSVDNSNLKSIPFECAPTLRQQTAQLIDEISRSVFSIPTDRNGEYALCVLPGSGAISVFCRNHANAYQLQKIPDDIRTAYYNRFAHALRRIDVDENENLSQFDLNVTMGLQKTIKFTTSDGGPVSLGDAVWNPGMVHVYNDSISVSGFHDNQPVTIMVRSKDQRWGKFLVIHENAKKEQTVKIERTVTLTGVAKHISGQPRANSELGAYLVAPQPSGEILTQPCKFKTSTDSDGRFEINVPFGEYYYVGFVRSQNYTFGTHDSALKPGSKVTMKSPISGRYRYGLNQSDGKWKIVGPF